MNNICSGVNLISSMLPPQLLQSLAFEFLLNGLSDEGADGDSSFSPYLPELLVHFLWDGDEDDRLIVHCSPLTNRSVTTSSIFLAPHFLIRPIPAHGPPSGSMNSSVFSSCLSSAH